MNSSVNVLAQQSASEYLSQANRFSAAVLYLHNFPSLHRAQLERKVRNLMAAEHRELAQIDGFAEALSLMNESEERYLMLKQQFDEIEQLLDNACVRLSYYQLYPSEIALGALEQAIEQLKKESLRAA